jgi:hypothetical protein
MPAHTLSAEAAPSRWALQVPPAIAGQQPVRSATQVIPNHRPLHGAPRGGLQGGTAYKETGQIWRWGKLGDSWAKEGLGEYRLVGLVWGLLGLMPEHVMQVCDKVADQNSKQLGPQAPCKQPTLTTPYKQLVPVSCV